MTIYNISKGQVKTLSLLAILAWFLLMVFENNNDYLSPYNLPMLFVVLIPFSLVFYIQGWISKNPKP